MSGSVERPITIQTAEEFFERLSQEDAETVRSIVENIRQLAEQYDCDNDFVPGFGTSGFFGVYAIAGFLTKQGNRPDVDLLIVTNAHWDQSYRSERRGIFETDAITLSGDWVAGNLLDAFKEKGYLVELLDEIPSEYDNVGANPKAMLRLNPKPELGTRKPIDMVYVKTTFIENIQCLSDFEAIDVDGDGKPLPRVALLKIEGLGDAIQLRE